MSKKYALIIGNKVYDDPNWPDLKTPELDAEAMAAVLKDPIIGGFDRVKPLLNASVLEMRLAIEELFAPRSHKPDDILLLYFSGHGELIDNDDLYFVGRETKHDMIVATGLNATYITDRMNNARSTRQVIILDSCFSGAFGKGGTENAVPTKAIFEGNGEGRYILASSEALKRSWENDATLGEVEQSFFTHFLVEGLRTGAADRDNDGWVHMGELYDHIRAGMRKGSRGQIPVRHALNLRGKLFVARSPISPSERVNEQLTDVILQAENTASRGDYRRAEELLNTVIKAEPDSFLNNSARQLLAEIVAEQARAEAYQDVKSLLKKHSRRTTRIAWQTFTASYPDYDPDNLAAQVQSLDKKPASRPVAASPKTPVKKPEKRPIAPKKPRAEDLLPAPFAWVKIPAGYVTIEEGHIRKKKQFQVDTFFIAKYPLTNAQFRLFIEAGGYAEKKWWTAAGWRGRKQGFLDYDYKKREWKPTRNPWVKPRYWTDKKFRGDTQPVVGVSWYEAVAYCRWLSEQTGQKIMLPTEQQWQQAVRFKNTRAHPWDPNWEGIHCRNSVGSGWDSAGNTSPITQYEGKGDSPWLAVNVSEWCLTEAYSLSKRLIGTERRVVRGGKWNFRNPDFVHDSDRNGTDPYNRDSNVGFRLALSL